MQVVNAEMKLNGMIESRVYIESKVSLKLSMCALWVNHKLVTINVHKHTWSMMDEKQNKTWLQMSSLHETHILKQFWKAGNDL